MNAELKFWGGAYLATGLVFLILARLLVKLFYKDKRSNFVKEMMTAIDNDRSPAEKRRKFFKSVAVSGLAIAVWPLTFSILINELRDSSISEFEDGGEPKFRCETKDLLEKVNPLEVEAGAKVLDPLGRVPDLPFGHLNKGWLRLRRKVRPGDVMWSFRTSGYMPHADGPGPRYEGPHSVLAGYAIVRNGKIVAEFLTEWN